MYAINTNGLPCIHDYAQAKRHYDSITPIRGSSPPIRPVGDRRKQHMQIVEGENKHGHYYAAKLYRTECVRWYERQMQILGGGWATQSTAQFIHAVSPLGVHRAHHYVWVHGVALGSSDTGLWFERSAADGVGGWRCLNPPEYYIKTLNKEATKRIRNLPAVKATQQYLRSMKALGAYELVGWMSEWQRKSRMVEILGSILQHHDTEPDLDTLAKLGGVALGPVGWDEVYTIATNAKVVTYNQLYDRCRIDDSKRPERKGVIVKESAYAGR